MMYGPKRIYWYLRAALKAPPIHLDDIRFYVANFFLDRSAWKHASELRYWRRSWQAGAGFTNDHFGYFYKDHFGLSAEFFQGKAILDIGCGPRGSLEWVPQARARIGLDPLALEYKTLRGSGHQMAYTAARSEQMPFHDHAFDVVASFNSIDHVDDLEGALGEVARVIKPGGLFLLITDVNHPPTACEPFLISLEIIERLSPGLVLDEQRYYAPVVPDNIYASIMQDRRYDGAREPRRRGIVSAKFIKRVRSDVASLDRPPRPGA